MLNNSVEFTKHCNYINKIYSNITEKTCNVLNKSKLKFAKPNSSWYIFVNFSNYEKQLNVLNIRNSRELSSYILDKFGIVNVAGEYFNYPGLNIRFSLVGIDLKNIDNENKIFMHMLEGFKKLINFLNKL